MRQRRTVLMVLNSIVLLAVVSVGLLTAMQHVVSPAERVTTAWQLARLSGSYAFRSEITQTTPLEPRLSNAGRHSTVAHYLVSGSVDESNQRVVLRIENADNTAPPLEIQRDHRKTYTRQPDGTWRELPNAQDVTMTDSLAYLAGVEHITAAASGSEYAFDFNGTVFADALRQSLQANAARGVTVNSEWTSITDGAMLRGTTGTGALVVDSDGLPQTLRMDLAIPQGGDEQVVRAQIVTTYTAFARTGIALKRLYNSPQQQLAQFFPGLTANDVVYRLWSVLAILTFVLLALVLYTWRGQIASRMSLVLVVLLVSAPLVNAPRSASAAERPQPNTRDTRAPQTIASDFDPRIPADQQASGFTLPPAGTQTAPANSASNGRSRSSSRAASSVDSDSDGLSDDQEYQIGTSLMLADTDIDGITDYVEVRIPSRNLAPTASLRPTTYAQIGTLLYTNPLSDDTNGDGMSDGVECPQHMILDQTSAETQIADCSDTDGDKVPDFLTADNDGDGVADSADSDPTVALYADATTKAGFSSTNPFLLRFDGLTPNKPVVVDLQFRPTLTRLLNADTAVYDWPSGDTAGQIQRTKDTTLAAPDDAAITAIGDASAGNGDVSVAAMLEIRVPVSATNYGVLPVKTDTAWSTGTNGIPTWLDTTKFAPYGINAVWSSTGKEVVLTIPVRQNRDENGTVTSLSATAFFETPAAEWLNPASVRLLWVVSMLQDSCPAASGNCTDTHRVQSLTPVQTYYSDYLITGLEAKEHNGYTAALIYDDPQSALQTSTNKYLFLSQAQRVVANAFVEDGYLSISDSARPTRALDQILDGSNNTSATLAPALTAYGATAGTTRISTYSYRTDLASMLVRTDELKKVLDTTACRTAASVTSCETDTNKQTILNGCKTDVVSLRCNPAVMIASESKSRSASLTDYVNNSVISFKEIEFSVTRAVETSLYAVSADGNWIANDSNSLASTSVYIQSTVSRPTLSFSNLDSDTVAKLTDTAGTWLLAEMLTPVTRTYNGITVPSPTSPASMIIGNSQPSVNWSSHHANILKVNEVAIALSIAKVKKSAGAQTLREFTKEYGTSAEAKALGALAKSISDLYGPQSEYNLADMSVSTDTQRAVLQGVTTYLAVLKVGLFVKSYKEMKNLQATAAAINKLQTFYKLNPPKGMVAGVKAFREISYLKSVKFSAKVGNAVAVLSVGATWAMAGVALASAKHDYERGNIIAGAIGETASTVLLAVLSATGPVGAAIGAVIGAIDALAAAICAALDESTTRSTAGQFLCGGISGLLSKVFTVYNSSLSVDPTDSYSFDSNQINNDAGLDDPGAGFTVGNGYHTSFTTRDFMEKMPLPAQFSSLYWFAQWDDIDVRDASFAYALGNTMQYTLLSTVSAGSQAKEWKFSSLLPAPVSGSAKNENHLSWGKDFAVPQYSTPLTTSGINVKLRDLIYTKANVIPAQTCYMTWAFGWPVSYCEIENHSDIDQTNLNDDDATSFDIFPATIDGFTALRPKNGDASGTTGYTFAWSNDTDALSFPAFRDADNDGLTLVQEKEYKTSDSLSDTDDDGISDQVEIGMGYPPTVVDGDHDGLTDYQESYYKTSPTMPDTDGDGLMDGAEVVRVEGGVRKGGWDVTYAIVETVPHMTWTGSDPLKADADGDGIVDQREKILGWSPYAKNDPGIISTGGSVQETTVQVASVSQSSTMEPFENSNYNAEAAVDGNTDGTVSRVSTSTAVTRNERNPWWQAKLATPTDIESITIYNTTGTGSSSISSGLVFLSDTDLGTSTLTETLKTTARAWRTVTCDNTNPCSTTATARHTVTFSPPVSAQYVRIQLQQSGQLMLSEVVINDGVVNDMVVRPGDTIVAQATVTNKLLGRNQRGSVTFVPDAMQTNLTTPPSDGFALGPNTSTSTRARIHVPGSSRVVDGTTVFRAGCAFTGAVLCLRMDDPPSNSETMTWDERSPVSRSVTCVGNTCPTLNESGDAWVFNSGTSKDYLTVTPDISGAFHANNTTLSLFVKPLSQSVATRPLFVSTDEHLRAELVSERPSFTYNGVTITSQSPLPIGSWAHLVFRYQDGKTSIWVNNALVAQSAAIRVMTTTSAAYMIGGTPTDASMSAIRDIQLYDTVLTPAQTRALQTGCTDALLVTCLTFDDSTTLDGSVIGQRNEVTLICGDACTTVANQTATFSTGSPLTIGNGVWLEQREFTIGLAFKPPASGTVTYLATSNPVNPLTFSAINAVPTVSVAGQSISVAAVPGGQWSYALIRYAQGKVSLSVSRVDNSTKPATVPYNPAATATSADVVIGSEVEPLWIGSNGAVIKRLTIHRVAVSDAAVSTMAQAALIDQNGRETAAPPVSDAVSVTADVRSSVVAPDINAGRKDVVCVPPTGVDLPSLCAPLFSLPPTVTNSTTASFTGAAYSQSSTFSSKLPATNAGDTNPNTYSVTGYESEPWLQIDLGSTKRIRSVTVVNRQHPTSYSLLTGAVVFLRRNGAPVGDDTTANLLASADTVAARGLMCASTSACATPPGAQHRVDFGSGYDARYVRIQLNAETSYLQIGEVYFNDDAYPLSTSGTPGNVTTGAVELGSGSSYMLGHSQAEKLVNKPYTVTFRMKLTDASARTKILTEVVRGTVVANKLFDLTVFDQRLSIDYNSNQTRSSTTMPLVANRWYDIAIRQNADVNYSRDIFINGVNAVNLAAAPGDDRAAEYTKNYLQVANQLRFGGEGDAKPFAISNFQIHTSALPDAAIQSISRERATELRFSFDEPAAPVNSAMSYSSVLTTGLTLVCASGVYDQSCPTSGVPGVDGGAVHFNGAQTLQFPADTSAFAETTLSANRYTVGMWIKPDHYDMPILGGTAPDSRIRVRIDPTGHLTYVRPIMCGNRTARCWPTTPLVSREIVPLDRWSYITVGTNGAADILTVDGGASNTRLNPLVGMDFSSTSASLYGRTVATGVPSGGASGGTTAPTVTTIGGRTALSMVSTSTGLLLGTATKYLATGQKNFTFGGWFYPTNCANAILGYIPGLVQLTVLNGTYHYGVGTSGMLNSGTACTQNTWQYIAVAYDGATVHFMTRSATAPNWTTKDIAWSGTLNESATYPLQIGQLAIVDASWPRYQGALDDIALFDEALSTTDLEQSRIYVMSINKPVYFAVANGAAITAARSATTIGEGYTGGIDDLRIIPDVATPAQIAGYRDEAPRWSMSFEDGIETLTPATAIAGVAVRTNARSTTSFVPEESWKRPGAARLAYRASCLVPLTVAYECPSAGDLGLSGKASTFNGKNTLLVVQNPYDLFTEIKSAGTIQLAIKPENPALTQTVFSYDDGSTFGMRVSLVGGKVQIRIGANSYTASTLVASGWNQLSFSWGPTGFRYTQNGEVDPTMATTGASSFTADTDMRFTIGGRVVGTVISEPFLGGIDNLIFTTAELSDAKRYAQAYQQNASGVAQNALADVVIDADAPTASVDLPTHTNRTPLLYAVRTTDATSIIDRVWVTTTTPSGTSSIAQAPRCNDVTGGVAFCPLFSIDNTQPISKTEGLYTMSVVATDIAANQRTVRASILVDNTAPTVTLDSNTRIVAGKTLDTYPIATSADGLHHLLTLRLTAADPVLQNTTTTAVGSGVKSVSVVVRDLAGRLMTRSAVAATKVGNVWVAVVDLPFASPTGFYTVDATVQDNQDNTRTTTVAGKTNPIEVDATAPRVTLVSPDPTESAYALVGRGNLTGRVSDNNDGRAHLNSEMRVRIDFEAENGSHDFDNRADTRFVTDCVTCPVIALEDSRRSARFNVDTPNQSLYVRDAASIITGTYSIALWAKISGPGTLVSVGGSATPRIRLRSEYNAANGTYRISAQRGAKTVTVNNVTANTWQRVLVNEDPTTLLLGVGTTASAMTVITTTLTGVAPPPVLVKNLVIGASYTSASSDAREDYFRGYIDDFLVSHALISPMDLDGRDIAEGSGTKTVTTRYVTQLDGATSGDTLAASAQAYYTFDETQLPYLDAIDGARSATCNGGDTSPGISCPDWTNGFHRNALVFRGTTDGVDVSQRLHNTTNTLGFMLKPTASSIGTVLSIVDTNVTIRLRIMPGLVPELVVADAATSVQTAFTSMRALRPDEWQHLVIALRRSSEGTLITLAIDGTPVAAGMSPLRYSNATLILGSTDHTTAPQLVIDDLTIFPRLLAAAEIDNIVYGFDPVLYHAFDATDISPATQRIDESAYANGTIFTSGDATLRTEPGYVGARSLVFDGNDTVHTADPRGLTMQRESSQPWSLATWVTKQTSTDATLIEGTAGLDVSAYRVTLVSGRIHVDGLGFTLDAPSDYTAPYHVAVSADGVTATLSINGVSVATTAISSATQTVAPYNIAPSRRQSTTQSSTVSAADNAADGNTDSTAALGSIALTTSEERPWWRIDLGRAFNVTAINLFNRTDCCAAELSNYTVSLSEQAFPTDPKTSPAAIAAQSTWAVTETDTAGLPSTYAPTRDTYGRFLSVQLKATDALGLAEVEVYVAPDVTIGEGFVGSLDEIRIYRRVLTQADITLLANMGWQDTVLSERTGGFVWSQQTPTNLEATVELQAATTDLDANTSGLVSERTLWKGRIDTQAPRIDVGAQSLSTTGVYTYSVRIEDRNLEPLMVQTPCGARADTALEYSESLWFRGRTAALDGKTIEPHAYRATCTLAETPEITRRGSFPHPATSLLAAGDRFSYVGRQNHIDILDTQNEDTLVIGSTTLVGTVEHLIVNEAKTRLYALSRVSAASDYTLTIYAIATNRPALVQRNTYTIPRVDVPTILSLALTTKVVDGGAQDAFLAILGTQPRGSAAATLSLYNVYNPGAANNANITLAGVLDLPYPSSAIAATSDVVAIAQGARGALLYQIAAGGAATRVGQIDAISYVNKLRFVADELLIIDDDEPTINGVEPISANILRGVPVIASRDAANGSATLHETFEDRFQFILMAVLPDDNAATYRIRDVVPYATGDILVVGNDTIESQYSRVAMLDIGTSTPLVQTTHSIELSGATHVVAARNNLLVTAPTTTTDTLFAAFQVNDRRLGTRACDRVGNCALEVPSPFAGAPVSIPATSLSILNQQSVYTDTTQLAHIHALAPAGIATVQFLVDDAPAGTPWTTSADAQPTELNTTFPWTASAGVHVLHAQLDTADAVLTTTPITVAIDLTAPQFGTASTTFGLRNVIDGMVEITGVITDDTGLSTLTVTDQGTGIAMPVSTSTTDSPAGSVTTWKAYFRQQTLNQNITRVNVTAVDRAGRTTTVVSNYTVDTEPPVIAAPTFALSAGTTVTPLTNGATISRTTGVNLIANWAAVSDISSIASTQVEYSVETITQTLKYVVPVVGLRTAALTTLEASKVSGIIRSRDIVGNESVTALGTIYVDNAVTPDYTILNPDEPYRGYLDRGCATLGTDTRSDLHGAQRFAATWDQQALRVTWNGADWENDGDLFIYVDTIAGGTVSAYQPLKYTKNISDTVTNGSSWMFLPSDMAGRTTARTTARNLTSRLQRTTAAQAGQRVGAVEGADYALHISNRTDARLVRWDGVEWLTVSAPFHYLHSIVGGVPHTELRIPYSSIGYSATTPFGLLALATDEQAFLPWATFPTSNPIRRGLDGKKIVITPLLNSYAWPQLAAGICGRTSALTADNVQIDATLTSNPAGVSTRGIADTIANADPAAIAEAILATRAVCAAIPNDPWCVANTQITGTLDGGTTVLQGLESLFVTEQTPRVGAGSVVTYTLTLQNLSTRPSKPLYGVVNTYGGIWIISPNSGASDGIVSGGNYTFHSIQNPTQRDYVNLRIASIPAGAKRTLLIRTLIDPLKSSASPSDRRQSAQMGKLELRLTDTDSVLGVDNARTVEWLNSAVRVDDAPPSQILPDAQTAIRVGKNRLRAMVTDDSTVKQVAMELYSNTSTTKTKVVCAITATKTWQCEFTVPRTWRFVYYRLRAVDAYGGVSRWTEWYRASIDRDAPSFDLSDATVAMLAANTIGGAGINLTGAISDTGSLAKMVVCDDTMAVCGATPLTSGSTATPLLVSGTVTKTTPIAAQPCSALDADSYTRYPIPLSDPDYLRVTSLALTLKLAHPAPAELALLLQSPSGTIVPLVDAATATAQQLHVRFLDTAPNTITTLPSDTPMPATPEDIHPAVALTTFSGEIMRGTWYVLACDTTANAASGSIQSATLALTASSQLTSAGLGAAWTFPLTNTDGVDSEPRNIKLWAMDAANNASPARSYTVNIDTVAPQLSATQVITQILNGGSGTVLSGMVTDGGAIDRVIANVYNGAVQVSSASLPLTPSVVPSASLYALRGGRSVASAAWNLSYTDTTLDPGTYAIQLTAYDRVGNARTSEVFTLTVPEIIPPTVRATRAHSSSGPSGVTIDARINPGNAPTTVTMHLALDSEISHNPSQSLISTWSSDGNVITSGVLSDISPLANERYRQIADNGRDVIVLTASGIITNIVPSATQSRDYTLPASVNEVTQISLGADHLLAVYSDGTIAGSGSNSTGQTTIPTGLGRVAAVAAGTGYSLALLESGVVTGWGLNDAGQTTIPVIAQSGVRQIVAGPTHALAIGLDGGVIAWGDNSNAKTVIPQAAQHSIIQIAAGTQHSLALTDDGNVVAWGSDSAGQVSVPPEAIDVVAIYAAGTTSAAVTRSGTVIFWGTVVSPPLENPALLAFSDTRIIAVHGYESTTRTTIVPAGSESLTVTVPFTSLLLNRRYRYTITATNRNGTTIVSDTYITQATPSTLFVPYVSTETGFTPVSVVTK